MPIFECSQCKCIENTATSNYWWDVAQEKKPALCSECDPAIGKWHGEFEKRLVADFPNLKADADGFLQGDA